MTMVLSSVLFWLMALSIFRERRYIIQATYKELFEFYDEWLFFAALEAQEVLEDLVPLSQYLRNPFPGIFI